MPLPASISHRPASIFSSTLCAFGEFIEIDIAIGVTEYCQHFFGHNCAIFKMDNSPKYLPMLS